MYGSNRGDDDLATFAVDPDTGRVSLVGHTATDGMTPRNFTLDPTGAWLYAANQGSDTVVPFAIDPSSGMPVRAGAPVAATAPTFIGLVALPTR